MAAIYIKCPDGKKYNTNDSSLYVKQCVEQYRLQKEKEYQECMADPKCKRENQIDTFLFFKLPLVIIALLMMYFVYIVIKK
jgi:hypothetical protein